jgi:hypothetical protein
MNDLISRRAAIDAVRTYYDDEYALADSIEELIEKLPSAQPDNSYSDGFADGYKQGLKDAQPIRHGHWLRTGRTNVYGGFEVECSVCNDSVMITNIEYEHYCRNCGARMDEEEVSE